MYESTPSVPAAVLAAPDIEALEQAVLDHVHALGRELAVSAFVLIDDELAAAAPAGLRVKDRRTRRLLTRFGQVEVPRRRYLDRRGQTRYLLDEHLSLAPRARISAALERSLAALSTCTSFRDAAGIVASLTSADVSHMSAHSSIGRAGTRLASEAAAAATDLHDLGLAPTGTRVADPLCCEADGTVIALQGARQRRSEVKLAVFYDDKGAGPRAVHAAFTDPQSFWREASAAAGEVYDLACPHETIVSGDGAAWVRGGLDALGGAHFVLDPFHINRALLRATGSWRLAHQAIRVLGEQGLEACTRRLRALAQELPERAQEIERVCGYLAANEDGLWRPKNSLGTIEGHIDKVLAGRFKKKGRRWSPSGADAMARVLAARRSGRPLPVGAWEAPAPREVMRPIPASAFEKSTEARTAGHAHAAGIVSNRTGDGFTRTLRDIAGTRKADY